MLIGGAWNEGVMRFSPVRDPVDYRAVKIPLYISLVGGALNVVEIVGGTVGGMVVILPWLLVPVLAGRSSRKLFTGQRAKDLEKNSTHRGVVTDKKGKPAPASGRDSVAFSIILRHKETESDTLVDAYSTGFDVKLDDGRIAHIPAGRVRLDGDLNMLMLPTTAFMPQWWRIIDPFHDDSERMPPYPYNQVRESVLAPGQEIVLQNELIMTTRQHRGADYRDASANILEPRGVPIIRALHNDLAAPIVK